MVRVSKTIAERVSIQAFKRNGNGAFLSKAIRPFRSFRKWCNPALRAFSSALPKKEIALHLDARRAV